MNSDHTWGTASGNQRRDCHMLAYRFPAGQGFDPATGESWVFQQRGRRFQAHLKKMGWYTHLWRSPAGLVYVTDADGYVQQTSAPDSTQWSTHEIGGMCGGVFGIDDAHVYLWGLRGQTDFMMRWDGEAWTEMPSPQGGIVAIHGTSPELLFAVGDGGLISRWDGSSWTDMPAPSDEPLRSVFVVSPDEVWACGNRGGLLQGSVHGWTQVLTHEAPLASVAKFKGDLWVGATGDAGLCKLVDGALDSIKPNLPSVKLESRGERLLFFNLGVIGDTEDGQSFKGYSTSGVAELLASEIPRWA